MSTPADKDRREAEATQIEMDGLVLTIELTLISIIQGFALSFLAQAAIEPVVKLNIVYWPYVVTGLLTILIFWSRSLIHSFTVIRWPLEFGHNFLYFICSFLEVVAFTQLMNVSNWFALNLFYSVTIWFLFLWDLRIIRRRMKDSAGAVGCELYRIVLEDQMKNIRFLVPSTVIFNLVALGALWRWPHFFVEQNGHLIFGLFQMGAALFYLLYGIRFYTRLAPMISKTRKEWRDDVIH